MREFSKGTFDTTPGHDGETAYALSRAADFAYQDEGGIKARLRDCGFEFDQSSSGKDMFTFINDTTADTQVYIAAADDKIIVAFRGTEMENREDWKTNANCLLQDSGVGGKAHYGMLQAFLLVWDRIADTIRHYGQSKPIFFTGHSLGGALATLGAAYCNKECVKPTGVYTFGAPRVGNTTFAEEYDSKLKDVTFRYVNDQDIVPCVPPEKMTYAHVGNVCFFTDSAELKTEFSFSDKLIAAALQWFDRDIADEQTFDHSRSEYVTALRINKDKIVVF